MRTMSHTVYGSQCQNNTIVSKRFNFVLSQIPQIHIVNTLVTIGSRSKGPNFKLCILSLKESIHQLSAPSDLNLMIIDVLNNKCLKELLKKIQTLWQHQFGRARISSSYYLFIIKTSFSPQFLRACEQSIRIIDVTDIFKNQLSTLKNWS